ncbi:hypothetical protein GCM10011581_33880 [Saccharopolyspora subtropica]|uniref:Uncharacterized protein n=1 Tax=Saccharopolyspora thermophila TaxID=89367 RepID=A0A917NFV7_9PSEU|nr:hypothetical protein [Saccharopolyspora subtropica]GGI93962.1 hypothetical protein GCM10011581_33880 [Saccharopolyspora subtropica]
MTMRNHVRLGTAALILFSLAGCGAPEAPSASSPSPAPSIPAPPPTPDQVEWLNTFCQATEVFIQPPEPPADLHDEFVAMDLSSYLSSVNTALDDVEFQTFSLAPEAFPRGAELIDSYSRAAERVGAKVDGYASQYDAAEDMLRGWVAETSSALATLRPDGLDLPTLMAENRTVAQAHQQAESCHPAKDEGTPSATPVELPPARDGENLAACADGMCEVLVTPTAVVAAPRAYGFTLMRVRRITDGVMEIGAKFEGGSITSPLPTGRSTIMNGIEIKAVAVGDGRAVLSLSPA